MQMAARATRTHLLILAAALTLGGGAMAARSEPVSRKADMTVREITTALFKAKPGERVDLSKRKLAYLDLSGLNFKGATLARSDLYGVDFTNANLRGTDLSGTRLDRSNLIRADLAGANIAGATILRPNVYTDLTSNPADSPRFPGANLTGVRVQANLSGADFHGADLTGANFAPLDARKREGAITALADNKLVGCDFTRAIMRGTNLAGTDLTFAHLAGADLSGANLSHANLSRTDFTGADLTDADLTGADLDGANLLAVKGLDTVKGLATALNFDRTIH
jgi:uncharacterized protein YjbI with pentapeptide repeats